MIDCTFCFFKENISFNELHMFLYKHKAKLKKLSSTHRLPKHALVPQNLLTDAQIFVGTMYITNANTFNYTLGLAVRV